MIQSSRCVLFLLNFRHKLRELARGVLEKLRGRCKFLDFARVEYEHLITFDYGLKAMSHSDHRAILKALTYQFLNRLLRHDVYVGSCFVEDHYLVLPQNGPAYADKGSLPRAQILTMGLYLECKQVLVFQLFLRFACLLPDFRLRAIELLQYRLLPHALFDLSLLEKFY